MPETPSSFTFNEIRNWIKAVSSLTIVPLNTQENVEATLFTKKSEGGKPTLLIIYADRANAKSENPEVLQVIKSICETRKL